MANLKGFKAGKVKTLARISLFMVVLCSAVACSGPKSKKIDPVFWPTPPSLPRIQFLKGIGDSSDVEPKKQSFSLFSMAPLEVENVKPILKPYGVVAKGAKVYLCDVTAGKILIMDLANKTFEPLKGSIGSGKLKKPVNMALDSEGNLYVADTERKEVVVYDADGGFLMTMGSDLEMKPTDVGIDGDYLFIVDFNSSDVKVLDRISGKLISRIGQGNEENNLALPVNMTVGEQGKIYVTNMATGKVVILDRDGHPLSSFGKLGDGFGQFGRPKDLAVDHEGNVYVVDAAHQNVQIFDKEGRLLLFFGDAIAPDGFMNLPAGIAITSENLEYFQTLAAPNFILDKVLFVTNQAGKNKVAIYGLGKKKGMDYNKEYEEILKEREARLRKAKEKQALSDESKDAGKQ